MTGAGPITQVVAPAVASGGSGDSGDTGDVTVEGNALSASSSGAIARGDATSGDSGPATNDLTVVSLGGAGGAGGDLATVTASAGGPPCPLSTLPAPPARLSSTHGAARRSPLST